MKILLSLLLCLSISPLFGQLPPFDSLTPPPAPDYALGQNWSALPYRTDAADEIPKDEVWINDSLKPVDVFYIHPTMYQKGDGWNASLSDENLNEKVDKKPVHYQASVFNQSCRVYAPRYRQAIVEVFYEKKYLYKKDANGQKALDLAYADVKRAFEYYLVNHNQGRPFILASHSQGSYHCGRLLQDYIDGKPLHDQMVMAYVIGFSTNEDMFENLKLCKGPDATGCFVSWMSYKQGKEPDDWFPKDNQSINPLTWTTDADPVDRSFSKGTILYNMDKKRKGAVGVQIHDMGDGEILWIDPRPLPLKLFGNMHIVDYNLFWYDIRENVKVRIKAFGVR